MLILHCISYRYAKYFISRNDVKADRVLATCIFIGIASPIMGNRIKLALLLKEGDIYFMKYCIKYNYELRGIYAARRQGFTC